MAREFVAFSKSEAATSNLEESQLVDVPLNREQGLKAICNQQLQAIQAQLEARPPHKRNSLWRDKWGAVVTAQHYPALIPFARRLTPQGESRKEHKSRNLKTESMQAVLADHARRHNGIRSSNT